MTSINIDSYIDITENYIDMIRNVYYMFGYEGIVHLWNRFEGKSKRMIDIFLSRQHHSAYLLDDAENFAQYAYMDVRTFTFLAEKLNLLPLNNIYVGTEYNGREYGYEEMYEDITPEILLSACRYNNIELIDYMLDNYDFNHSSSRKLDESGIHIVRLSSKLFDKFWIILCNLYRDLLDDNSISTHIDGSQMVTEVINHYLLISAVLQNIDVFKYLLQYDKLDINNLVATYKYGTEYKKLAHQKILSMADSYEETNECKKL